MSTSIYYNRIATSLLFVVLSTVGIAYAITNGEPDGEAHPYVAFIAFGQESSDGYFIPQWWCSGSLIDPTVMLTAGHCTNDTMTGEYPTRALVWFEEQPTWGTWDPESNPSCAGETGFPCTGYAAAAFEYMIHTHPAYTGVNTEPPYGGNYYRDVGVVELDTAIDDVGFAILPEQGQVDELNNKAYINVVGFGYRYQAQIPGNLLPPPPPPPANRWTAGFWRYQAQAQMISGEFSWSDDKMRITLNQGGGTGGTAPGDSGGPNLLAGTDVVLAVTSYAANNNFNGVGNASRVDIPDVLEWIEGFLP